MNNLQITELIIQVTRIADALERIQNCGDADGSLYGIEGSLWKIAQWTERIADRGEL